MAAISPHSYPTYLFSEGSTSSWLEKMECFFAGLRESPSEMDKLFFLRQVNLHENSDSDELEMLLDLLIKMGPSSFLPVILNCKVDLEFITEGNSYLLTAIANARNCAASVLIDHFSTFDFQDQLYGNSALHLLVAKGYKHISADRDFLKITNFELMEKIIKRGVKVNLQNAQGNTPLHLACARRDLPMMRLLLLNGAEWAIQNHLGQNALDMLQMDYKSVHDLLEKTAFAYLLENFPPIAIMKIEGQIYFYNPSISPNDPLYFSIS